MEALRHALTTPHTQQGDLVGKKKRITSSGKQKASQRYNAASARGAEKKISFALEQCMAIDIRWKIDSTPTMSWCESSVVTKQGTLMSEEKKDRHHPEKIESGRDHKQPSKDSHRPSKEIAQDQKIHEATDWDRPPPPPRKK
jgi:hypothetical protein